MRLEILHYKVVLVYGCTKQVHVHPDNLRGIHGRDEVEGDVTTACGLQCDKCLHVFQVVDLTVSAHTGVRIYGQHDGLLRAESAAQRNVTTHLTHCVTPSSRYSNSYPLCSMITTSIEWK